MFQKKNLLTMGINHMVVCARVGSEDLKFRAIFKTLDGEYLENIKYQLTIDEVDPK